MLRTKYKALGLIPILAALIFAEPAWAESPYKISVETDPATFAFNGYAAHVRIQSNESEALKPWTLGLGVYSMKFPSIMRDLAINQSTGSATLKLQSAYGVFIDRHFSPETGEGLFVGAHLAYHQYDLTDSVTPNRPTTYNAWLFMPRIGYEMKIGKSGLYVLPWLGIGYLSPNSNTAILGNNSYSINHWLPFGTLHVGYTF